MKWNAFKWQRKERARPTAAAAQLSLLWSLCLLCLLSACQQKDLDGALENYVDRLGTALDIAPISIDSAVTPHPPRIGKLQIDISSASVGTLDFMALTGCALQVTIGKRNSSLGRFARPSQRLLLELEYLRLAPACISHLRTQQKTELADVLQQSREAKKAQLPALIFNATLGGEEYRAFWLARREPGSYPPVPGGAVVSALGSINHHIRRWLEGDYRADNRGFEILLSEVAGGDGGPLLQSLARQDTWLAEANRMLEQRMGKGPLCGPDLRHDAADVLPQITRKFFIGEIQPRAAQMERRVYDLLPAITALEQLLQPAVPARYLQWKTQRDQLLASARLAPHRHVDRLAEIQQPCTGK